MPSRYPRSNVGDGWDAYRQNVYVRRDKYSNSRDDSRDGDISTLRRSRTVQDDYYDDAASSRNSSRRRDQDNYGAVRIYNTRDTREDHYNDSASRRNQYGYGAVRRYNRGDDYADDDNSCYTRRSSRRDSAPAYDYGDDQSLRRTRSERQPSSRRDQAQQRQQRSQSRQNSTKAQQKDNGEESDFFSKHFDKSSDGWIAAAAGAGLGAITARHFGGPTEFSKQAESKQGRVRKNWKSIAGAAVGALAVNATTSGFKGYFEDEHQEDTQTGAEFLGETVAAVGPDIL